MEPLFLGRSNEGERRLLFKRASGEVVSSRGMGVEDRGVCLKVRRICDSKAEENLKMIKGDVHVNYQVWQERAVDP